MTRLSMSVLILLVTSGLAAAQDRVVAVVGGVLFDPGSDAPVPDGIVLVEGGRIVAVGRRGDVAVPEGAEVIDAQGRWVIPALVDAHVHFFQSGGLYTRPDAIDLRGRRSYEAEIAGIEERLTATFARYVACGITGVADVGGPFWNFEVREKAASAEVAPDVVVAGPLISTYEPEALKAEGRRPIVAVSGPEEARELVRAQVERKTDLIKIWFIVGRGRSVEDGLPIVEATMDESRKLGVRVAVHATELETARAAVLAGASILVHSVSDRDVDDAFVRLLRERDVTYVPTLMVGGRYRQTFSQKFDFAPEELRFGDPFAMGTLFEIREIEREKLPRVVAGMLRRPPERFVSPTDLKNLTVLHAAGVRIAAGTDAGNIGTPHGPSLFKELEHMAAAGLTPLEVLRTATIGGAHVLNAKPDRGRLAVGQLGDLVILDADPQADVRNLARIHGVLRKGRLHVPESTVQRDPASVVQHLVNAYNARDLEAFLGFVADDVVVMNHPSGSEPLRGKDEVRRAFAPLFSGTPDLHCRVAQRIVQGRFVVDHEVVTGTFDGAWQEKPAVVIHEVKDGRLVNAWFLDRD